MIRRHKLARSSREERALWLNPLRLHVRSKRCASCVFSAASPVDAASFTARLPEIERTGYQECHHSTVRHGWRRRGPSVCCRGYYDRGAGLALALARILDNVVFVDDDGRRV